MIYHPQDNQDRLTLDVFYFIANQIKQLLEPKNLALKIYTPPVIDDRVQIRFDDHMKFDHDNSELQIFKGHGKNKKVIRK